MTLNTLTMKADPLRIIAPELPIPCLTLAISPVNKGDEEKIMQGLIRLKDEDVTFDIVNDPETRQFRLSGLGEVQLDVLCARLKSKFGVEAEASRVSRTEKRFADKCACKAGIRNRRAATPIRRCWIALNPVPARRKA